MPKKAITIQYLTARRTTTIEDMRSKMAGEDWHGVADAAMDLREIDAALEVFEQRIEELR